ncbi:putative fungal-specific transcription factor [Talaromyces proteolyticus]|uniref:Fungal-specific transcription factor n=1 Tax=Talaromyces proteolyticus TaxID=1131652 RepID=A0AAD4KVM0_9EURO|nr:putative fungal-specific transcription factor [Talaromyces proteolyticus]KAH8697701.1 putative fungal-specific transcription factor [Talaromyces proteolyticus]
MPLKATGDPKRRTTARRKVALACDSCREKKTRCDGIKPICGPCVRRSYRIDQCVYNAENARSASRGEYFHSLCQRIRELEDACSRAGVSIQTSSNPQHELPSEPNRQDGVPAEGARSPPAVLHPRLEAVEQNPTPLSFEVGVAPSHRPPTTHSQQDKSQDDAEPYESLLFDDGEGHITGMGQITAPGAESRRQSARSQFYGNSSAASLMRFAWQSMSSRPVGGSRPEPVFSKLQDTVTDYRFDDFSLPPRALADSLLNCFFNHIYTLYPFFHRPAFEAAYQNLWRAEDEPKIPLTDLRIGLGSSVEFGPRSIVFHSALNVIFALGCQFADIAPEEVELVSNSFFLRAKRFIGLDFLDINTLGVVQTLLITAVFLQSSPYPSRCWHSVGVACRVALGLGLHESDILTTLTPLESNIRQRTWHGCVIMDTTLSMTYGRPSMTTHLATLPPPSDSEISCPQNGNEKSSLMAFYTQAIKLYGILDRVLADVYYAWRGQSRRDQSHPSTKSLGGLDTILEIERQLKLFEINVPSFLKWTSEQSVVYADGEPILAIAQQRNVLRARYIHLHLLLYRPIFTQLYSERNSTFQNLETQSALYSYMCSKCATACVMAAIDLIHLIHETYQTNAADAWWYNGFYVSTAAVVLLMSFSAPSMLDPLTMDKAREAWREATAVLESMATFSRSASNTLQFLQAAYRQAVQQTGRDVDTSRPPNDMSQAHDQMDYLDRDLTQTPFFNWEDFAANMGSGVDDLGFLTRLDFPDSFG